MSSGALHMCELNTNTKTYLYNMYEVYTQDFNFGMIFALDQDAAVCVDGWASDSVSE